MRNPAPIILIYLSNLLVCKQSSVTAPTPCPAPLCFPHCRPQHPALDLTDPLPPPQPIPHLSQCKCISCSAPRNGFGTELFRKRRKGEGREQEEKWRRVKDGNRKHRERGKRGSWMLQQILAQWSLVPMDTVREAVQTAAKLNTLFRGRKSSFLSPVSCLPLGKVSLGIYYPELLVAAPGFCRLLLGKLEAPQICQAAVVILSASWPSSQSKGLTIATAANGLNDTQTIAVAILMENQGNCGSLEQWLNWTSTAHPFPEIKNASLILQARGQLQFPRILANQATAHCLQFTPELSSPSLSTKAVITMCHTSECSAVLCAKWKHKCLLTSVGDVIQEVHIHIKRKVQFHL